MTTEATDTETTSTYRVRVDRETCDGIFACLVRDGRFREAEDGLVVIDGGDGPAGEGDDELIVTFTDDRIEDARQAAQACPVDAIDVTEVSQ